MKRLLATAAFAAALALLLVITARAAVAQNVKLASESQQGVVEGIVVPDSIYDRQAFSFAVPQVIAGEVVSIQSVEGVVVQRASTDKYGRVFLAAGLPAGAYMISGSSHQAVGKIKIIRRAGDALEPPQPMQLQNPPHALKLSDPWSLNGYGFSPDHSKMQVSLTGSGKTEAPMVLAATEDQLKLAPVQQLQPGAAQLQVTNQATGQRTDTYELLLSHIQGNLLHRTMTKGEQTQLVITIRPDNQPLKVKVNIVSGPVDFGGGRKEAEAITNNGQAIFLVHAERGSGPFQLTWELVPLPSSTPSWNQAAVGQPHN